MASWYPAEHTYTGDAGGQLVLPHYKTMPASLTVYDTGVRTSGWTAEERRLWRKALRGGVARWGLTYTITEKQKRVYPPEGITVRGQDPDPDSSNNYGGFGLAPIEHPSHAEFDQQTWDLGKGFALIHPTTLYQAFAGRNIAVLTAIICHEVGHALGFGHGGTGIMESAINKPYFPNAEELSALKAYWT